MPKRPNPFGDGSPLQLKSHIGKKEVDMGVNKDQHMQNVYGKKQSIEFESQSCHVYLISVCSTNYNSLVPRSYPPTISTTPPPHL